MLLSVDSVVSLGKCSEINFYAHSPHRRASERERHDKEQRQRRKKSSSKKEKIKSLSGKE